MINFPSQLPQLRGRALTVFRVFWWVIFALALAGTTWNATVGIEYDRKFNVTKYNLGVQTIDGERRRTFSPLSAAIAAQGLKPNSILVAVDGRNWPQNTKFEEGILFRTALGGPEGTVHTLTLLNAGGRRYQIALPVRGANLAAFDASTPMTMVNRLTFYRWRDLITSLLLLSVSVILFLRRPGEAVVALLSLGMIWGLAASAAPIFGNATLINGIAEINLASLFMYTGILAFPSGEFRPRWSLFLFIPIILLSIPPLVTSDVLQLGLGITMILGMVATITLRYRQLVLTSERQQIKWASFGIVLSLLLLLLSVILDFFRHSVQDPSAAIFLFLVTSLITLLAIASLVLGLLISLLRFRLYDAETVVTRSALYGGLALAMIAVFAGTEKLVELFAERFFGESIGVASGAIAAGIAAAIIPLFHRRLERWAERRFQRTTDRVARQASQRPRRLAGDRRVAGVGA